MEAVILQYRKFIAPGLAIALIMASAPVVALKQPDYLPSHLAQAVAVAVGFGYFYWFQLWKAYPDRFQRALLILAFAAPLDNLLAIKAIRKTLMDGNVALEVFRPVLLLLIASAIGTAILRPPKRPSPILTVSAALALASWIVSSAAATDPAYGWRVGSSKSSSPLSSSMRMPRTRQIAPSSFMPCFFSAWALPSSRSVSRRPS
ncbi:hypothetical protein HAP41_0000033320 [Bradyrhizobium barranii subsp. apii]|uniref:Uncharacterized protein n=1 Tax=Bradyrhizobium barranii subsp. apii TaxID=2819348 RepID=A0A8T5VB64_9BRAD|nr:hypothetical protein [Bradyrhizobium barranii]UPT85171.1 hypothetical protein HAP41_0000033320 [Bradyrhizobium barranii subsp. apii]